MIGKLVGNYRVVSALGEGGMGAVYLAEHQIIGSKAAIKVLLPAVSQNRDIIARFFNEAKAATAINHPGIVEIYDVGYLPDQSAYMVMELLEGESLSKRLQRLDKFPADDAMRIARHIAIALAAAHERGIVHRDLKPDNVYVVADRDMDTGERVKVLDFGIAKLSKELAPTGNQTATLAVMGTPPYMAPEQCRGAGGVDLRTDIYALGCMLYEFVCGRPPFAGGIGEIIAAHMHTAPPQPRLTTPALSAELEALVLRLLAKDPAERPQTMDEVISALDQLRPPTASLGIWASETRVLASDAAQRPQLAAHSFPRPAVERSGNRTRSTHWAVAIAIIALLGASGAGAALLLSRGNTPTNDEHNDAAVGTHPSKDAAIIQEGIPKRKGMVFIEGKTFAMGSTPAEVEAAFTLCQATSTSCKKDLYEREQPVRTVTVSSFFLDKTEVTNHAFATWLNERSAVRVDSNENILEGDTVLAQLNAAFVGIDYVDGRFVVARGKERLPTVLVTWLGANAYCTAQGTALPTEAQWELAARGVERRTFPWGNTIPHCNQVIFGRGAGNLCESEGASIAPVASAPGDRTPHGVADLGGNVAEWVADRFHEQYPACSATCIDPIAKAFPAKKSTKRVLRGGFASGLAEALRSAGRSRQGQTVPIGNAGFRCAASPHESRKQPVSDERAQKKRKQP